MIKDLTEVMGQITEHKYFRIALTLLLSVLLIMTGYFAYGRYRVKTQEDAQKILAQALEEYKVLSYSDEKSDLASLEKMFEQGYLRSKNSTLAPIFLVYQADLQGRLGDLTQARNTLEKALALFGKTSPFYDLYDLKKILIDLDQACGLSCDADTSAVSALHDFAYDTERHYRGMALQHLINFYQAVGNHEQAAQALKELEKISSDAK